MTDLSSLLSEPDLLKLLESLRMRLQGDQLDYDTKDDPCSMDTLGTLIDKLVTVDMKMWHNQEHLYAIRRMTAPEFVERFGAPSEMSELHATIKRCCDLNVQRARLMDAIDIHFADVVSGRSEAIINAQHKIY